MNISGSKMIKKYLPEFCKITTNFYYSSPDNFKSILKGGNEIKSSNKEGKYKIFTFADRNDQRIQNMKRFKSKTEKYSVIDEVRIFNLNDVDKDFISQHQPLFDSKIFPWISKVYIINKWLEKSDDGDIIFWIDSDIVDIIEDGVENLFNICNNSEKGVVGFHNDFWLERVFTKSDVFNYLGITDSRYWNTNQAYGGAFVVKKNSFSVEFFKRWLDICSITRLIDNSPSNSIENTHFITHKNDQSILSLLYKIHNIKTFPLPLHDLDHTNVIGNHSGFFDNGAVLPLVWEPCWHNISIKKMWENCNNKYNRPVSPEQCLSASYNYFHN